MRRLESFTAPANVAVVGAAGGIGSAFCEHLRHDPDIGQLFAFSRTRPVGLAADGGVTWQPIDIGNEASIAAAAETAGDTPLDLVLVTTGVLHRGASVQPERRLAELDPAAIAQVMAVNAIGPAIIAKYFLPRMRRSGKTVFAALSARVGSISDNRLGGWAAYRASKAALNQFIRTIAIEQARLRPESIVIALHPGTVDTALSKPFTGRTPEDRLFTPGHSASYLLDVIAGLSAAETGGFFAWDGSAIAY